jgi:DNA-binding CsgD family transcriptional regulator
MSNSEQDRAARSLLDLIHGGPHTDDPHAVVPAAFEALRGLIGFSSGVHMPIEPQGWSLRAGHAHDSDASLVPDYLRHFAKLDPYVIHAPCLRRPNEVVAFSEVTDASRTENGEFGDFMRRVPYFHALAMVPFLRGAPLGVFSIHRRRNEPDFDAADKECFRWFVTHLANSIDYRRLAGATQNRQPFAAVLIGADGTVAAMTDDARRILGGVPESTALNVPPLHAPPAVFATQEGELILRATAVAADSLLASPGARELRLPDPEAARLSRRLSMPAASRGAPFLLMIEPIAGADLRARLVRFGLTAREAQVAVRVVEGQPNKEIAEACGVSLHTIKEHVTSIYRKAGVASRAGFLAAVLGSRARSS